MNTILISRILLTIAILASGIIYGTDMFYAIVSRKATALSKDSSIADLVGHTHFVADKRHAFRWYYQCGFVPRCLPSSTI